MNKSKPNIDNKKIGKQLLYGERRLIAAKTGYSHVYVMQVLQGIRNNCQIIKVAKKIIENRNNFLNE